MIVVGDFLLFLIAHVNGYIQMPGTLTTVMLGNDWLSKAESARDRSLNACDYEYRDLTALAGEEWQKIFGTKIPIHVL